jgi:3D (Asp-Asp-Asp) domain-containing protein
VRKKALLQFSLAMFLVGLMLGGQKVIIERKMQSQEKQETYSMFCETQGQRIIVTIEPKDIIPLDEYIYEYEEEGGEEITFPEWDDDTIPVLSSEWEEMAVEATAYTAGYESTGKKPGHPAYGITKSGTTVKEGRTIATDPKVIPLGSEVLIPCLSDNVYIAEDIGGAIKGNKIDIYMENLQDAKEWGRQTITIYVRRAGNDVY